MSGREENSRCKLVNFRIKIYTIKRKKLELDSKTESLGFIHCPLILSIGVSFEIKYENTCGFIFAFILWYYKNDVNKRLTIRCAAGILISKYQKSLKKNERHNTAESKARILIIIDQIVQIVRSVESWHSS